MLALALFGFVVALGGNTPVHGWLTQLLPVYGSFRAPARIIVLWALALSVLAAFGLDALLLGRRKGNLPHPAHSPPYYAVIRLGVPASLLVLIPLIFVTTRLIDGDPVAVQRASLAGRALLLATIAWLATWLLLSLYRRNRLPDNTFAALLLVLSFLELFAAGAHIDVGKNDPTRNFSNLEVLAFLQEQAGTEANCAPTESAPCPDAGAGRHPFRIDVRTGIYDLWQPNTAALTGLHDVGGIYNPLELLHWKNLWENNGGRHTRIYDLLNVLYVLVRDGTPLPEQYTLAYDAPGPLAVYQNPDPLPRAWLVAAAQVLPDQDAVLAALKQPSFEPLHTVFLEHQNNNPPSPTTTAMSAASSMSGPVSVLEYSPNEIVLAASADRAGYLVLSEVWFPGWLATVNGVPAPVLRANYTFRALPVPAGELQVRLWYAPESWRRGLALLGVGILLLAGLSISRPIAIKVRNVQRSN